jgi:hypothetical protein
MKRSCLVETQTKRFPGEAQRHDTPRESGQGLTVDHALGSTGAPTCLPVTDSTTGTLPTLRSWISSLAGTRRRVGPKSQRVISSG